VGDFAGKGNRDFAVANQGGGVSVLLGNGDGTFQPAMNYLAGVNSYGVATGDFNGDGIIDLAVAAGSGAEVLLGNGDGTFQTAIPYSGSGSVSIAVGEFNGDGSADLAVATGNSVALLLTDNPATMTPLAGTTPQAATPGTPFNLAVLVMDGAGNRLYGAGVTFTAPATGPSGTFGNSQSSIVVNTFDGIASVVFTANSSAPGPYIVTVAAGDLTVQFALSLASRCDVRAQGAITVSDAQYMIGEALGLNMPTDDLTFDGAVTVADVQTVLNGVLTMSCVQ
jgi:hypothetical protein